MLTYVYGYIFLKSFGFEKPPNKEFHIGKEDGVCSSIYHQDLREKIIYGEYTCNT